MKKFIVGGLLLLACSTVAFAHGWYPIQCCAGQDCRPVACEDISETLDGFVYDGVKFSKASQQPSQDQHCHVCIFEFKDLKGKATRQGRCIFTLQGT